MHNPLPFGGMILIRLGSMVALLAITLLTGCECIINHFDGKAQAYKVAKEHWKIHPECEGSMICRRTGGMIPPGPWKTGKVGTNQYHGVLTNVPPQPKDWPTNASNVGVYFTTNTISYETYPPTIEHTVEAHFIKL